MVVVVVVVVAVVVVVVVVVVALSSLLFITLTYSRNAGGWASGAIQKAGKKHISL